MNVRSERLSASILRGLVLGETALGSIFLFSNTIFEVPRTLWVFPLFIGVILAYIGWRSRTPAALLLGACLMPITGMTWLQLFPPMLVGIAWVAVATRACCFL
jgi:hypothetical protein